MKPENIISAAQARLNFCDPEYVALYKEINNRIIEESRDKTHLKFNTTVKATVRNKVIRELRELGFTADYFYYGDNIDTITVSW